MEMKLFVEKLLQRGIQMGASDLYIFPKANKYELIFRIHEQKQKEKIISGEFAERLILYLKYFADMDVGEKRRIQIGSATFKGSDNQDKRMRLSIVADYRNQETVVIRFLHDIKNEQDFSFFLSDDLEQIKSKLNRSGLFLFAGATGSGKTTTMYQLAREFSKENAQVITIEDPVEIEFPDFLQLQTNEKINITYDNLVQVCLRHRPDLLIVGEIRDRATAQAVIRGALTGHTIFSTIHGMDKYSVLARLLELGINKEDLRQCLKGVIYQKMLSVKNCFCLEGCFNCVNKRQSAVLYDTYYYKGGRLLGKKEKAQKEWQKKLGKIWALGFISTSTYYKSIL